MGFPTWTLWGMGLSAFGALIAVGLALLAQSPRLITRLNLTGQRLDLRARSFTGYGFALLLLAMGFFLAGVPLDNAGRAGESPAALNATPEPGELAVAGTIDFGEPTNEDVQSGSGSPAGLGTRPPGGSTGAMAGLVTPANELAAGEVITGSIEFNVPPGAETEATPGEGTVVPTMPPPATPTTTPTATPFPTATPTTTPTPTLTPTPIFDPTARVNDETSTLPVRYIPGGQVLVVLVRGDLVILHDGRAFHSGQTWRQISTVDGLIGWVPDRFLDYGETEETG